MGSSDKYLIFLWNQSQIAELLSIADKITEITIVNPIFELSDSRINIVSVPYLRGFVYYNNTGIIYTGIGCHKIGGILIAVETSDKDSLKNKLKDMGGIIIATHDISVDFFCKVRIKIDDIEGKVSCKIERSPVHVPLGKLEILSTNETSYDEYDAYSLTTDLIITILIDNNFVKQRKLNVLIYEKQNGGYRIDKKCIEKDIKVSINKDDIKRRLEELFITKPKKLKI